MKTVHHIDPKPSDTFSFNCPVCGCAHMERDPQNDRYWTCHNGHEFYVSVYQSSAKTLNLCFMPLPDEYT
jgi:hypothetical protein